jgi:WD40 repeat protein
MTQGEGGQGALLSSAVEIGGGVARGVWAGIKMGAKVAGRAGAGASAGYGRLAKSAPAGGSVLDDDQVEVPGGPQDLPEVESKSLGESSTLEEDVRARDPSSLSASLSTTGESGGEWIKIIDLFPRRRAPSTSRGTGGRRASLTATTSLTGTPPLPEIVAHFRLPSAKPPSSPAVSAPTRSRITPNSTISPVSCLSFSPDGTRLLASPSDGRSLHILEVHPAGLHPLNARISSGNARTRNSTGLMGGEVWHQYELRRGNTSADVSDIQWSNDGRWVGVGTSRGTVRESLCYGIFTRIPYD